MFSILSKEEINQYFRTIKIKKNEILFKEEEICNEVGFVLSGELSISSYSFNGNEIVFASIKEGDIFGNNLIFAKAPKYKGHVICKKDAKIRLINRQNLITLLQSNYDFLISFLEKQSNKTLTLNNKIKTFSFDSAEERLLYFLKSHDNKYQYRSISSLAEELNLRRETLSRLISYLVNKKVIHKDDKFIKLI